VDTHNITHGDSKHAVRVIQAQIFFTGEWQMLDVVQRCEVTGLKATLFELMLITGNIVADQLQGLQQALQLPPFNVFARQAFSFGVPDQMVIRH
jgi:hypothetical protein